jgi:metal-responsive CopG/Arc/MetJ family transcriptional regulator
MQTVQLTLDPGLVAEVDKAAARLKTTRSAFTRGALRDALARLKERELERKHRAGYARKPVKHSEFPAWEKEQVWGDG